MTIGSLKTKFAALQTLRGGGLMMNPVVGASAIEGPAVAGGAPSSTADAVHVAVRNSLRLGLSLIATWSVALLMRFFLPRYLGPTRFGVLNFADATAAASFIFLSLGIDVYVQKEVSGAGPAHASDFFGGLFVVRMLLSALLLVALAVTLRKPGHRTAEAQRIVFIFGLGQIVLNLNSTLVALLQASASVTGLALVNVAGKLTWGALIGLEVMVGARLEALAGALLVSETLKAATLLWLARRQLGLVIRFDLASTSVLLASFPFYINAVAITLCAKLDVTMLALLTNDDAQVGWGNSGVEPRQPILVAVAVGGLGADADHVPSPRSIAGGALANRTTWPRGYRGGRPAHESDPALGAKLWIRLVFGAKFAPASMSLFALAPVFNFTYVAMLLSMSLIMLGRGWTLTMISCFGVILHPLLSILLVPYFGHRLGIGGAGVGSALSVLGMEMSVTLLLLLNVGKNAFDRRSIKTIAATLVSCVITVVMHRWAWRLSGDWRLALDALTYVSAAVILGAIDPGQLLGMLRSFWSARRATQATDTPGDQGANP